MERAQAGHPHQGPGDPALNPLVDEVTAAAATVPTDVPEADGTLAWDSTTIVVVHASAGGRTGIGWTYAPAAAARLVTDVLAPVVTGLGALDTTHAAQAMQRSVRNMGRSGIAATARSALDIALWDLKARLLGVPLHRLLGAVTEEVPVYGSGGFTTYDERQLAAQVADWVALGVDAVKIKIAEDRGTREQRDLGRIRQVRELVGAELGVFVDANGGYDAAQAIRMMDRVADADVTWLEEPVTSDDAAGLRRVREAVSADVTAGEYTFDPDDAHRLCAAGAVDCLQVDLTRCGGITGWRRVAAIATAYHLPLSGHCAPYLSLPVAAATTGVRHLEFFHDHDRIARMLFRGVSRPVDGRLRCTEEPGHGLALDPDAFARYRVA